VKQNWLGFTDGGNSGHGLGRGFGVALHGALTTLLDKLGSETATESTHLEKLALVRAGIGRDTISDFTTNLIKHFLLDYTQAFTLANVNETVKSSTSPGPHVHGYDSAKSANRRTNRNLSAMVFSPNNRDFCWRAQPVNIASKTADSWSR
jgi:hypothetical protein